MTWTRITTRGHGKVRFALVIEGWPEIWVTDSSITLTDANNGAAGRTVRVGLLRKGLGFSERALLAQGKIQASGMTVSIVSADNRDHATASFARVGQVVALLAGDLETGDGEIDLSADIPDAGYYHLGTEVLFIELPEAPSGGVNNPITARGLWDTQAQSFYLQDGSDDISHQLYAHPRTVEGRRATLYVWGEGDDVTGYDPAGSSATLGHPVWRGVVAQPPQLASDGMTWTLQLEHISALFKQQLCARNTEIRPVGIHFPVQAPLYVSLREPVTAQGLVPGSAKKHFFWARDRSAFLAYINDIVAALVADSSNGLSSIFDSLSVTQHESGGFVLTGRAIANATYNDAYWIDIRSHYTGFLQAGSLETPWVNRADGQSVGLFVNFQNGAVYDCQFSLREWATTAPTDTCQPLLRDSIRDAGFDEGLYLPVFGVSTDPTGSQVDEWEATRIWINQDFSTLSSSAITVARNSIEPRRGDYSDLRYFQSESLEYDVIDSGYDSGFGGYWIRVDGETNGALVATHQGWLHADSVIRPAYSAAERTDVVGLVSSVIDQVSANANDGNLPFIRAVDFLTTSEILGHIAGITDRREYRFVKPIALDDAIGEELKMLGHMWSTHVDSGKLMFRPIPLLTANIAANLGDDGAALEINSENIQTPAGGQGRWPSYEVQSQGLVSMVTVKDGYDASTDEHRGISYIVRDQNLLSTHKRRGVSEMVIAPKSAADIAMSVEQAEVIAARMLAVLGREYVTIKVQVPFSCFRIPLGYVVSLTSPHVPNSDGGRGLTNKRCVVIGRRWNLDPGRAEHGELELLALLSEPSGYCPSGVITGQSGATTTWTLTLDSANAENILISPRLDGDVASTFAVGDAIRILELNNDDAETSGDYYPGTVTAVGTDTVSVTLAGSWTPAFNSWALEYDEADNAQSSQRSYAFVSGADAKIGSDEAPTELFA